MPRRDDALRFGPEPRVTMRDTGEHVKVECWSSIAVVHRVPSLKHGLQFASEADLVEICAHPEVHFGKYSSRGHSPRLVVWKTTPEKSGPGAR